MGDTMEISHVGIGKLITEQTLQVPFYQRSYSWTVNEVDDLVDDILGAKERQDSEYFLGSVVLTGVSEAERPKVVDGQQRLATVTMIFGVIRDWLFSNGNREPGEGIAQNYLYMKGIWADKPEPRLQLNFEDRDFFTQFVLVSPELESRINGEPRRAAPDSHKRIAAAFRHIADRIDKLISNSALEPLTVLQHLEVYLKRRVKVVVIHASSESNAFQVFETLNDRGLDLSIADLLKNYIFGQVGEDNLDLARNHWVSICSSIRAVGNDRTLLKFIHHFWASNQGLVREKELFKSIKEKVRGPISATNFSSRLEKNSNLYCALLNGGNDLWRPMGDKTQRQVKILCDLKLVQCRPLLLAVLDTFDLNKNAEISKVISLVLAWSVRFRVTHQFGSGKLEKFYMNAGKIVRENDLKTAVELSENFYSQVPGETSFKQYFETFEESNSKWARYFLKAIEDHLAETQGEVTKEIRSDEKAVNLEHVLPKSTSDLAQWPNFDSEIHETYRYRLGNQTLLTREDNRKLSNKDFLAKKEIFGGSDLVLAVKIGGYPDWTKDYIEEHQKYLASHAATIWPRKL